MFRSSMYHIVVSNDGFIIKKTAQAPEINLHIRPLVPNIPFYYHLFDKDKPFITDLVRQIKALKMKHVRLYIPDDAFRIEADQSILTEFFMRCGAKTVQVRYQCLYMNANAAIRKYISLSRTVRATVLQYIIDRKIVAVNYYDKNFDNTDQLIQEMRLLHIDFGYQLIPVFINQINGDMDRFLELGDLVSMNELFEHIFCLDDKITHKKYRAKQSNKKKKSREKHIQAANQT